MVSETGLDCEPKFEDWKHDGTWKVLVSSRDEASASYVEPEQHSEVAESSCVEQCCVQRDR